jgi:hypothetical protein
VSAARLDAVDRGLPRRLSTCADDPAYDERAARLSDRIAVFLDGVELQEVASWDVDRGSVTRKIRREDGRPLCDEKGHPAYETLGGHVEVRWLKESVA